MKKLLGMVAAAIVSTAVLVGCGDSSQLRDEPATQQGDSGDSGDSGESGDSDDSGDSGDYCSTLAGAVESFGSLDEGDFSEFDSALDTFHDLADQAPAEVESQWEALVGAIDEFEAALEAAGVSFSDLDGLASGELPEGVDQDALLEALATVEALDTVELTRAGDEIQAHGEAECGVTFPE